MDERDFFTGFVVHCAEANFQLEGLFRNESAEQADLYEQKWEMRKPYNPYHNLFLDKRYGEGK